MLEAKQDDVQLDPEKSIPILEFGQDAQSILESAADAFQDAVDGITKSGGGHVDDKLYAQFEGKETALHFC